MASPWFEFVPFPETVGSPLDFFEWLKAHVTECGDFIIITHDELAALAAAWNTKEENLNGKKNS